MRLHAPAVIGHAARFAMRHPVVAAGNLYTLLWSPPFAGSVPLAVPGLTVQGHLRIDLANAVSVVSGVLTGQGVTPDVQVPIPNVPPLVGYAWDLQGVDLSGANVLTLADDDLEIVVSAPPLPGANMLAITPGTFVMGSVEPVNVPPYYNQPQAQPAHQVTISRPFWICRYEVTQAEYQAVMGVNPALFQGPSFPNGANQPVEQVSWNDAKAYCGALTVREILAGRLPTGYQYRLPTEAEWEYCCRAGTTTEFHVGQGLFCGQANFLSSLHTNSSCNSTNPVVFGSYQPNAWGLADLHGNVWEWCLDAWDGSANYPASAVVDPFVSGATTGPLRVGRGGSWASHSGQCRSAARNGGNPNGVYDNVGFRVVLAPALAD